MLEDGFIARVEPLDQDTIFNFAGKTKGAGSSSKSGNGGSANGSGGGSSSAGSSAAKSSAGRNGHGTTASPSVRGVKGSARGASTKSAKSSKNKKKARPQEAAAGFAAIMGLMTSAEVKTEGKRRKKKKKPATPRDQVWSPMPVDMVAPRCIVGVCLFLGDTHSPDVCFTVSPLCLHD